jgi:uncharacterized protein YydD (DUF2326 family)
MKTQVVQLKTKKNLPLFFFLHKLRRMPVISFFLISIPGVIKNIWVFRKVILHWKWWDYYFLLELIKISVSEMSVNFEKKGTEHHDSKIKKIEKMNRLVELIERIQEGDYLSKAETELNLKYSYGEFKKSGNEFAYVMEFTEEQEESNKKISSLATDLDNEDWCEIFEILKGQNLKDIEIGEFDGTGLRTWWD